MNKLFTKIATLSVGLAMAIGVGVAVRSKETTRVEAADSLSYTITFKDSGNSSDGTAAKTALADIVSSGDSYVSSVSASYVYQAKSGCGVKLGSGNYAGVLTLNLSSSGQVKATKVVYELAAANDTGKTIKLSLNGATSGTGYTTYTTGSTAEQFDDAELAWNGSTNLTSIKIDTTAKKYRTYLKTIKVYVAAASKTVSSVSSSGHKTSFSDGESFSYGGTLTATYSDASSSSVTPTSYKFGASGINPTSAGTAITVGTSLSNSTHDGKYIYVLYTESGTTVYTSYQISVSAPKVLSSISVSGQTTTFDQGDTFAFGGTVTAHYEDTTTADVTSSATFSGYDLSTSGSQTVTVSYGGKSTTYSITVNTQPQYELIKSTTDLVAGSKYLIGHDDGESNYFISTTQNSNNRAATTGTVTDDVVTKTASMQVIELGGATGNWEFIVGDGPNYLYTAATTSNRLLTTTTLNDNARWTISIENTGVASISNKGNTSRGGMAYNANSGNPIFNCYSSGGNLNIYKLVDKTESIQISQASVSDMKGNTNTDVFITANNFTPTGISTTYSVAGKATVTAGTISDGVVHLNVACNAVGSTVATITVAGSSGTLTADLSITVNQKPASLTLVNENIEDGEIEVKHGSTRQISFTALDTDGDDYSINYSGITASSSNANVRLSGTTNMVLNGDNLGDAVVTCTITATSSWQTPITQTLTVHVIDDYNEDNVNIVTINGVNVDQGDTLVIADHISSATARTHFKTINNPIEDDELLFSYTNNRSAGVVASNFVWDVTDPTLDAGETETRTVYVFVTFNEDYAGTSFTAVVEVEDRPVVGLKVDGVSKSNGDDIDLELPRNTTYNFNEHVTVDPTNATDSHTVNYAVEEGGEYVSVSNGVMTVGSKTGETVACVSATPAALDSFTVYFWISITREAMTITADLPMSATKLTSLSVDDTVIFVYEATSQEMSDIALINTNMCGISTAFDTTPAATYQMTVETGNGGSGYSFKTKDNTYLSWSSGNTLTTSATKNDASSWTISESTDGNFKLQNVGETSRILQYNTGSPRFACYGNSGQTAFQIYRISGGVTEVTVNDALFNVVNGAMSLKDGSSTLYDLGLCDASGTSFNVSAWNTLGSSFTSSIISDNKLAYVRADENGNEIEQFLAVYDYVIGKKESGNVAYASANDYLGRVASGKISHSNRINPLATVVGNSSTAIIVIVTVGIAAMAIGGYFLLRKKKED